MFKNYAALTRTNHIFIFLLLYNFFYNVIAKRDKFKYMFYNIANIYFIVKLFLLIYISKAN